MTRDYISTQEAADLLGVSRSRVIDLIKGGRLPAEKVGGIYFIKEDDLELVRERRPGRPKKPAGNHQSTLE